jgi:hypothetical protein
MNNNFKNIFCIFFVLVLFGSCNTPEKYTATIYIQDQVISNEQVENTVKILKKRLALLEDDNAGVFVNIENKKIVIQSPVISMQAVIENVITSGKLAFRECYRSSEVYSLLNKAADALDKVNPETNKQIENDDLKSKANAKKLLNLLNLHQPAPGNLFNAPELAYVKITDTMLVGTLLNRLYPHLPKNIRFLYGRNQFYEGVKALPLYAVKFDGGQIIDNQFINKTEYSYNQFKKPVININLKKEGAVRFSLMTRNNINRPIAIIIDELVYSAPIVASEITGGNIEITGGLAVEEAQSLANAISSGYLPLKLKLHSLSKTQKK